LGSYTEKSCGEIAGGLAKIAAQQGGVSGAALAGASTAPQPAVTLGHVAAAVADGFMRSISAELRRLRASLSHQRRRPAAAPGGTSGAAEASSSPIFKEYFIVIAALVYFMGWMFLYYYLLNFGIDIFAVDLPFYYFFVYAFAAIRHVLVHPSWTYGVALLAIAVLLFALHWIGLALTEGRAPPSLAFLRNLLGVAAVAIAFIVGHQAAYGAAAARTQALRFDPAVEAQFHFRKSPGLLARLFAAEESPSLAALATTNPNRPAIVILETSSRYFVLVQPVADGDGADYRSAARVVEVARDDVKFVEFKLPNAKRQ
jgi:hypothetical protein